MLAKSELKSIEKLISQALIDIDISHEEFVTVFNEKDNYERIKDNLRTENEKYMPSDISWKQCIRLWDWVVCVKDTSCKATYKIKEDKNTIDYPNWFDRNKFEKILAIIDSNKFNYKNKIGEFKYIDIKDLVNNIRNNTISEISAKKGLNTLNEIKNAEIIKYKKRTPGHKELLNLFNDLLDIILTDKTLMSSKDKNENGDDYEKEDENEDEDEDQDDYENENEDDYENENEDEDEDNYETMNQNEKTK